MPMSSRSSATSASTSTPPRGLKRNVSRLNVLQQNCNSSDTEEPWTPPQKRFRFMKDPESPTYRTFNRPGRGSLSPASSATFASPVSSSPRKRKTSIADFDLTGALRACSSKTTLDLDTIKEVKTFPRGEADGLILVKQLLHRVKVVVKRRIDRAGTQILATELYLEWLKDLDFVVTAVENLLGAKVPGTRKRVSNLGRITFTILYQLLDGFMSEVDSHHDGWSHRSPEFSARAIEALYPDTMTIIEESQDDSTDERTEQAVHDAEELLARYDAIMAYAVRRYKIECGGRGNVNLADAIGSKEHALSRACCLLCEQTGYGSDDNDHGDTLLQDTRAAMHEWKEEFGSDIPEDEVDNDELSSD